MLLKLDNGWNFLQRKGKRQSCVSASTPFSLGDPSTSGRHWRQPGLLAGSHFRFGGGEAAQSPPISSPPFPPVGRRLLPVAGALAYHLPREGHVCSPKNEVTQATPPPAPTLRSLSCVLSLQKRPGGWKGSRVSLLKD